jgi:hypothetical protein
MLNNVRYFSTLELISMKDIDENSISKYYKISDFLLTILIIIQKVWGNGHR